MVFFGKIIGADNAWGFDFFSEHFEQYIELDDEEHIKLIKEANATGKIIQADNNGYPILVDPPEPTDEEKKRQRISELERYLSETDWYAIRFADTGEEIPSEVKNKRQKARDDISSLREELSESEV